MAAVTKTVGGRLDSLGATSASTEFARSNHSQSVLRASVGGVKQHHERDNECSGKRFECDQFDDGFDRGVSTIHRLAQGSD